MVQVHIQDEVGLDQDYSTGDGGQSADSRSIWKVELTVVEMFWLGLLGGCDVT